MLLWLAKSYLDPEFRLDRTTKAFATLAAMFLGISALMLIPLPPGLVNLLSPGADAIYRQSVEGYASVAQTRYVAMPLSVAPYLSLASMIKTASYAGVFLVAVHELRDPARAGRLVALVVCVGAFEALYGLFLYTNSRFDILGFARRGSSIGAWGTYVNKNHFAGYLGMAFFLCLGVVLDRMSPLGHRAGRVLDRLFRRRSSPILVLLVICLVLMAIGIFFANSRAGAVAFVACICMMLLILIKTGRKEQAATMAVIAVLTAIVLAFFGFEHLLVRLQESGQSFREGRLAIWLNTLHIAREFPLFGSGTGTFRAMFQQYMPEGFVTVTWQAHNDYLELFSETGAAGTLLALGALGLFTWTIIRKFTNANTGRLRAREMGAAVAALYMLLLSLMDFNLQIPANAYLFTFMAAIAILPLKETLSVKATGHAKTVIMALAAALVLFMSYSALSHWRAEALSPLQRSFTRANEPIKIEDHGQAIKAERASRLYPQNPKYPKLMGQYRIMLAGEPGSTSQERTEHINEARAMYLEALRLSPAEVEAMGLLAWTEFQTGQYKSAIRHLDTTIKMAPTNYFPHIFYAMSITRFLDTLPESMKRPYLYQATMEFERGMELNPRFRRSSQVLVALAKAFIRLGDKESALERIESIRINKPWVLPHIVTGIRIHLENGRIKDASGRYASVYRRYENLGEEKAARDLLEYLEEDASEYPALARTLLMLSRMAEEPDREIRALKLQLRTGDRPAQNIHYEIGLAYEKAGERGMALQSYTEALRIKKHHK